MTTSNLFPPKDPDARLDYKFDWKPLTNGTPGGVSDWLRNTETISSFTLSVSPTGAVGNLAVDASSLTDSNTSVTAWLTDGVVDVRYAITCHIITSDGREDDRTIYVPVASR